MVVFTLIYHSDRLPMQLWDESRNANNALEIALHGHWLVPTYGGLRDHWNTKPPLLIWLIAALLKLGVAPLWALRLPAIAAALATLTLVWIVSRRALRDDLAAIFAGAFLVLSTLYIGVHATRTGDYDGLESLFVLGYALCLWRALGDPVRPAWLWSAGALIFAAVMTKGVAGVLPLPGCAAPLLRFPRRLLALVRDRRAWAAALATAALCLGYYATRELYDPGYLRAVADNELGGRFLVVQDEHVGGPFYYLQVLARGFQPGLWALPLALLTVFGRDPRRRDLALVTLGGAMSLLIVLSCSKTKLPWYVTPAIPLLSLTCALGASDALAWLRARSSRESAACVAIALGGCAVLAGLEVARDQDIAHARWADRDSRIFYGPVLTRLRAGGMTEPIVVFDQPGPPAAGPPPYNPIVAFYATLYAGRWRIQEQGYARAMPPGTLAVTCDRATLDQLRSRFGVAVTGRDGACALASY